MPEGGSSYRRGGIQAVIGVGWPSQSASRCRVMRTGDTLSGISPRTKEEMRNSKRKYVGTGGTRAGYERGREKVFQKGWTGLAGLTQRNSSSRRLLALREMTNCFDKDFIEIIWAVLAHGGQLCTALCRKTWDQQSKCVCVFSCMCFSLCVCDCVHPCRQTLGSAICNRADC